MAVKIYRQTKSLVLGALFFSFLFAAPAMASNSKSFKLDSGVKVKLSKDAGAFYCEHVFYLADLYAKKPNSSIKKDSHGDSLVGFLHVPLDSSSVSTPSNAPKRKVEMIQDGVASAIYGYVKEIQFQQGHLKSIVRILLTGFGSFKSTINITDNPTEAFINNSDNVLSSVQKAFSYSDVKIVSALSGRYLFEIKNNSESDGFYLEVDTHVLSVSDLSLNEGSGVSIVDKIKSFRPQAVISMGVMGAEKYLRVESRSSDEGLSFNGGQNIHEKGAKLSVEFFNYSLWRAMRD